MTKEIYTSALSEVSYTEQNPEIMDFWKQEVGHLYVHQGHGGISDGKMILDSEGFSKCSALLIKNSQTLESALFHIDEWNLNYDQTPVVRQLVHHYLDSLDLDAKEKASLLELSSAATRYWNLENFGDRDYKYVEREAFKARMEELNHDATIRACYVRGDLSRNLKSMVVGELLSYLGISVTEEILVKTKEYRWGIAYKPQESVILVDARVQKKVLSFKF
ncbi:MAG: hypothetical protein WCV90_03135 [Candidatus Woesearchaeota archaeon]